MLLQSILGARPDAARRIICVDPVLPDWLSEIAVFDLRIGDQIFDLEFRRTDGETTFRVTRGNPAAVVWRRFDLPL